MDKYRAQMLQAVFQAAKEQLGEQGAREFARKNNDGPNCRSHLSRAMLLDPPRTNCIMALLEGKCDPNRCTGIGDDNMLPLDLARYLARRSTNVANKDMAKRHKKIAALLETYGAKTQEQLLHAETQETRRLNWRKQRRKKGAPTEETASSSSSTAAVQKSEAARLAKELVDEELRNAKTAEASAATAAAAKKKKRKKKKKRAAAGNTDTEVGSDPNGGPAVLAFPAPGEAGGVTGAPTIPAPASPAARDTHESSNAKGGLSSPSIPLAAAPAPATVDKRGAKLAGAKSRSSDLHENTQPPREVRHSRADSVSIASIVVELEAAIKATEDVISEGDGEQEVDNVKLAESRLKKVLASLPALKTRRTQAATTPVVKLVSTFDSPGSI